MKASSLFHSHKHRCVNTTQTINRCSSDIKNHTRKFVYMFWLEIEFLLKFEK